MKYSSEYVIKIKTKDDGWLTLPYVMTDDIETLVKTELKTRGIRFKNHTLETPQGYRCAFHFWDQGSDKYGCPKPVAAANEIFV